MGAIGDLLDLILVDPLTNLFVLLTVLLGNAGLAVIVLTIIIRIVTYPLTMRQMRMTRTMAAITPRMQEIQKRYTDPRRRSEEQMKLYREAGINPLGCFGSMLIQLPIFIALIATFRVTLGEAPEAILALSDRLYDWSFLKDSIPLEEKFLWLNLGKSDPLAIPVLVAITTYIYQKVTSLPPQDEKQAAQANMMNMLMPLMFAWFTLTLPSGVGLYYVLSNLIGMIMQYVYIGGGSINLKGIVGLNRDPVLPKALEVREAQMESIRKSLGDEPVPATNARKGAKNQPASSNGAEEPASSTASARRRRRYASGKRRGRR